MNASKLTSMGFGLALVLSSTAWAAGTPDCRKDSNYKEITRAEVAQVSEQKSATILDANSSETYQEHHVPGAIHFDPKSKDLAQVLPTDHDAMIVAYCGGPKCGAWKKAAEAACSKGYTNIRHFTGGIEAWVNGDKKS